MNQIELDAYLQELLAVKRFTDIDSSQNGLQVANSGKKIVRIALAVDACLQSIERAVVQEADLLLVHHGLFWKQSPLVNGVHYKRLKALFDADMALYALHLPLESHLLYGNNATLAELLELTNIEAFGSWHGLPVGLQGSCIGKTGEGIELDELVRRLAPINRKPQILPFGNPCIKKIAVLSGTEAGELGWAIEAGCDAFVTGQIKQESYHSAYDHGITVIATGHYTSETLGVQRLGKKLENDFKIHSFFIDVPTGI